MTEQKYVPSTFLVRLQYSRLATKTESEQELEDEFDRWYAAEIAAAEQRGAERGWDQCRNSIISAGRDHTEYSSNALDPGLTLTEFLDYTEKALANPYRADQEGNE